MKISLACEALLSFCLLSAFLCLPLQAEEVPPPAEKSSKEAALKGSEDSVIANFHSLGEIAGRSNIYRCANPVGAVTERLKGQEPTDADRQEAKERMQHLYDLGVRTVVSLQNQEPSTATVTNPEYHEVVLEKAAAQEVGITYVAFSIANRGKGKNSLQYMPEEEARQLVESVGDEIIKRSETGGVAFHCKSGKDRTGLVAGYLRIKYQQWTIDDAIAEMRKYGHVWKKFLKPDNTFSWHENHLRAITAAK